MWLADCKTSPSLELFNEASSLLQFQDNAFKIILGLRYILITKAEIPLTFTHTLIYMQIPLFISSKNCSRKRTATL